MPKSIWLVFLFIITLKFLFKVSMLKCNEKRKRNWNYLINSANTKIIYLVSNNVINLVRF